MNLDLTASRAASPLRLLPCFLLLFMLSACSSNPSPAPSPKPPPERESPSAADEGSSGVPTRAARPTGTGVSPTLSEALGFAQPWLTQRIDAEKITKSLKAFTAYPHPAASPRGRKFAQLIHQQFLAAGLQSEIEAYHVLLPVPQDVTVEMLVPQAYRADLVEEAIDEDFDTHTDRALPPFLAFSPDGEITAPLVYLNFSRKEDFAQLERMRTPLKGSVGIARFSNEITPAAQVRQAQQFGLQGLILYSDPKDDGFTQGDTYPEGAWRPGSAVRRASVLNLTQRPGDPLTPNVPATKNSDRLASDEVRSVPSIIAAPLSWQDARPFLESLKGAGVPRGWQGGLAFPYHIGGTKDLRVRLSSLSGWEIRTIWNVVARLEGVLFRDEEIIVGFGHDAWVHGASTSASSTAVALEAARVLGELAKQGRKPSRTITFCAFDATAYGLFGSVEHLDQHRSNLSENAALYISLDSLIAGGDLRLQGSPELRALMHETVSSLMAAAPIERDFTPALLKAESDDAAIHWESAPHIAPLAGPNNSMPFVFQLGVPALSIGSSQPCPVAGSLYETYGWMKRFGDSATKNHVRATQLLTALLFRSASATMHPYDFEALASWLQAQANDLSPAVAREELKPLFAALDFLGPAGQALSDSRKLSVGKDPDPSKLRNFNRTLLNSFRLLLKQNAIPGKPWFNHLFWAPDPSTGTTGISFPAIRSAAHTNDTSKLAAAVDEAANALNELSAQLHGIAKQLKAQALRTAN